MTSVTGLKENRFSLSQPRQEERGYTLLEICFALCILATILGAALPNVFGWIKEERLRAPARQLALLARTARLTAIEQQQPFQIMLHADKFWLEPVTPLPEALPDAAPKNPVEESSSPAAALHLPEPYLISAATTLLIQRWTETKFQRVVESSWIFQPSGLCEPITVKFIQDNAELQIAFDPLTATIANEKYVLP